MVKNQKNSADKELLLKVLSEMEEMEKTQEAEEQQIKETSVPPSNITDREFEELKEEYLDQTIQEAETLRLIPQEEKEPPAERKEWSVGRSIKDFQKKKQSKRR